MKILLLSRYGRQGASSRYRSYLYLDSLSSRGHEVTVAPLLSDHYLDRLYSGRRTDWLDVGRSYLERLGRLLKRQVFDLIWIEYEIFPWLPHSLERWVLGGRIPYVVDYDDAIFHRYGLHPSGLVRHLLGRKIDRVMRGAAAVVAGNSYLAERAVEAGAPVVEVIPTIVDLSRYPSRPALRGTDFTIGWIGTPQTVRYLSIVADVVREIYHDGRARVVTIGARSRDLEDLPVQSPPWSEEREVTDMQTFAVGIMPLADTPWERGKCGHKLIKYMACGLPVVASPVGVNAEIVSDGVNGFLAADTQGWRTALRSLRDDPSLRAAMGREGRRIVEQRYHLGITAPILARTLERAAGVAR